MRKALIALSPLILALGSVGYAPHASADQVWHQAVGRTSADSSCPNSTVDDVAAGWSQWGASWEQWPNSGNGGYACTRSITWAKDSTGAGCAQVEINTDPDVPGWGNFGSGYFVPRLSTKFIDPGCSVPSGFWNVNLVSATDHTLATQRCAAAVPGTVAGRVDLLAPNIYFCDSPT